MWPSTCPTMVRQCTVPWRFFTTVEPMSTICCVACGDGSCSWPPSDDAFALLVSSVMLRASLSPVGCAGEHFLSPTAQKETRI